MKTSPDLIISLFLIMLALDANGLQHFAYADYPPPIQQAKHGVPLDQIKCNQGFVNIFKKAGGSPACTKLETALKLVNRNWGLMGMQTAWLAYKMVGNNIPPWSNATIPYFHNNQGSCTLGTAVTLYLKDKEVNYFAARFNQYGGPNGYFETDLTLLAPQNETSELTTLGFAIIKPPFTVNNNDYFGQILPCVNP